MRNDGVATTAMALMALSGLCSAMQPPTNAMLLRASGSAVNAAFVSFLVGTLTLLAVGVALRARPDWSAAAGLPWYAWMGGVYGAVFVTCAAYAVPRIGAAATLAILIAGQALGALLIDQFGAFGVIRQAATPMRLAGMALVVGGVLLVRRG